MAAVAAEAVDVILRDGRTLRLAGTIPRLFADRGAWAVALDARRADAQFS